MEPIHADQAQITPADTPTINGKKWKILQADSDAISLETEQAFGQVDHAAGYAYAEIMADGEGDAILGLGSDDGICAWWNGRRVLAQEAFRSVQISQDQVVVQVRDGINRLLLKIYDAGGGYGFAADLQPVEDNAFTWSVKTPLSDTELLDLIERKAFLFFQEEYNPETGLIADHAPEEGPNTSPCSVASIGFGLTAICIADERGWMPHDQARERVLKTLRTMLHEVQTEHGFYYHFIDMQTGERAWHCELSSIDTALLLAGALTCRNYFDDGEITALAETLYARVDWPWMLNGKDTLSMGWTPEDGFIEHHWDGYSEHMVMYLLAIGSPSHPLPPACWHAWDRPVFTYDGLSYVQAVPLFLHQYSHCWVDFRAQRDAYTDYFLNSQLATRAHRNFCIALQDRFPKYSPQLWGLTASSGPEHYMVWGGPPPTLEYPIDGTIVPCAAGGSVAFTPGITVPVLRTLYEVFPEAAWGKYGLIDAFNPHTGWTAQKYIGIDVGVTLLMIENLRTGAVWEWFMQSPEIQKAMTLCGFVSTKSELDPADKDYLRQTAGNAWTCIQRSLPNASALPRISGRNSLTTPSVIGLYLADLVAACELDFLPRAHMEKQVESVLSKLEHMQRFNGFFYDAYQTDNGSIQHTTNRISSVENAILGMGLVVAAQAFPALHDRCITLAGKMKWNTLYVPAKGLLQAYVHAEEKEPIDKAYVDMLGTEDRAAALMAIAFGDVPVGAWENLKREYITDQYTRMLSTGSQNHTHLQSFIPGIFLDEEHTLMGRSTANRLYADMIKSTMPDDDIQGGNKAASHAQEVAPYISAAALEKYPWESFANLVRLTQRNRRKQDSEDTACLSAEDIHPGTGQTTNAVTTASQSIIRLSIANYLGNDVIQHYFMSAPQIQDAVARLPDFRQHVDPDRVSVLEPDVYDRIPAPQETKHLEVPHLQSALVLDGLTDDWSDIPSMISIRYPRNAESGKPEHPEQFAAQIRFAWDEYGLYMLAQVTEDDLVGTHPLEKMYKDDVVELYLDPACDGFYWGHPADFQIGFCPTGPEDDARVYAWFQETVPPGVELAVTQQDSDATATYTIETTIPWSLLNIENPAPGMECCASVAVHTVNQAQDAAAKLNWSYVSDVASIQLGRLLLVE
jgi:hypothetical protein